MEEHAIRAITAAEVRPLRHTLLRPHQPPEALVYPGDDAPETLHAGAFQGGRLVGIASVTPEPCPALELPRPWRLRGMATMPEVRGLGYGRALIVSCLGHIATRGGAALWCNGRTSAAGFYTRLRFQPFGEEFITDTGPHYIFVTLDMVQNRP